MLEKSPGNGALFRLLTNRIASVSRAALRLTALAALGMNVLRREALGFHPKPRKGHWPLTHFS